MSSPNGLVCFTNCLLPQEDGKLVEKDLWIDEQRGVILDAQVRRDFGSRGTACLIPLLPVEDVFREERKAREDCGPWW